MKKKEQMSGLEIKTPTEKRLSSLTEGWILWAAGAADEMYCGRFATLLRALPKTGRWTLVVFREQPETPVVFTSVLDLIAAVGAVDYRGVADRTALEAALPQDGLTKIVFETSGLGTPQAQQGLKRLIAGVLRKIRRPSRLKPLRGFLDAGARGHMIYQMCVPRTVGMGIPEGLSVVEPPSAERYADYKENSFLETTQQPLSTFGLDVDTASYTTMRRYLTDDKMLPPKESVRLEEFVNYFTYDYPTPTDDAPVAVNCELAPCPWAKDHKLLRVGVQAKRVQTEQLPPSNLVFLLDVSGSMDCNGGFEMLKKSMRLLVDQLREVDHVSIVTYADETTLELPPTSGAHKDQILAVLNRLECGGCTYGSNGIQLAYEQARKNFDPKANNRVILMTDGDFNVGIQSPKALEAFIREQRGNGIFLSLLGVGMGNYHDDTMKRLSTAGKGNYAFIDNLLEAKKVLVNEFGGTLFTVAKDVKLQLEFNPAQVGSYRLLGYECRSLEAKDFNDDKKDGGETGSGHSMTAFYELVPTGVTAPVSPTDALKYQQTTPVASDELLTVKLRYKEPQGETSRKLEYPVKAVDITRTEGASEDFRFASAVAEFALLLEDSPFKGKASYDAVLARARDAKGTDEAGLRAEFIRLVETAQLCTRT